MKFRVLKIDFLGTEIIKVKHVSKLRISNEQTINFYFELECGSTLDINNVDGINIIFHTVQDSQKTAWD